MKKITVPLSGDAIDLNAGDLVELSGKIYCGRDAILPHIVDMAKEGILQEYGIDLNGAVIFHTAVSCAGVGPTTTGKPEIENSIIPLSEAGAKFHLGKGVIRDETVKGLKKNHAFFLITPPVTALLTAQISESKAIAYPEFGMEAFYEITVEDFPAIVAVANGESIFPE